MNTASSLWWIFSEMGTQLVQILVSMMDNKNSSLEIMSHNNHLSI